MRASSSLKIVQRCPVGRFSPAHRAPRSAWVRGHRCHIGSLSADPLARSAERHGRALAWYRLHACHRLWLHFEGWLPSWQPGPLPGVRWRCCAGMRRIPAVEAPCRRDRDRPRACARPSTAYPVPGRSRRREAPLRSPPLGGTLRAGYGFRPARRCKSRSRSSGDQLAVNAVKSSCRPSGRAACPSVSGCRPPP
jgi:hypothetical protein